MADDRSSTPDDTYQQLRRLAALGYQLRATLLAADRFLAHDIAEDTETAGWLVSSALGMAEEVANDLDGFAKAWKKAGEPTTNTALHKLRMRAHQLQASARAADHFLDQDNSDDRANGSWLVASALTLADKLAGEAEDLASAMKRGGSAVAEPAAVVSGPEAAVRRAAAAAAATARGATV